ncbi:GGDEF domain-containing protein [Rhizobium sp. L1K21]|uniref:GGDEF domain-containing protein n=1 Tax=Rhizobium sp. L1K21 TaxID=2954933 RepID=UPI0020921561|nr:GGDEF domain-containing protein [Rhizobium sp. L1K21]MCO6186973.1 GGDEF domain-containing protein [Rhizobium sp. L1K21]
MGPVALSLAILCPLFIGGPMSAVQFLALHRTKMARMAADEANQKLEAMHAELMSLHSELVETNRRDSLTGILNRGAFMGELAKLSAAEKAGALFVLDADHFKSINDNHGHVEGDLVLKALTAAIAAKLPQGALFGRIGGEEFAVFVSALSTHAAFHHAENMRLNAETVRLYTRAGDLICPTISLGGVLLTGRFDVSEAMRIADTNLYRAKSEGRNKTVIGNLALAKAS